MLFGEYIKKLRTEKKWTIIELSKRSKVNNAMICDYENGKRPPPGASIIYRLAKALGVSYVELHKLAIQQEIPDFDIKYYDRKFSKSAFYSEIDPSKLPEQGGRELKTYFDYLLQKYAKQQPKEKEKVYTKEKSK